MDKLYNQWDVKQMTAFGDLLSSVFEEKFRAVNMKDSAGLLHHSVAWKPFPTFVKMYSKYLLY